METITIKTEKQNLILRQLTVNDASAYYSLLETNRVHLSQFGIMTEARYQSLDDVTEGIINHPNQHKLRFGVWNDNILVGSVALITRGNKRCEIGGWIGSKFTKQGFASFSLLALAKYAMFTLNYSRVIATTHPDNQASQNMLKKTGFTPVRKTNSKHYFVFKH